MSKCFRYSFVLLAVVLFIDGIFISSYNLMLIGILCAFVNNIIYCFEQINNRILFLFFNIVTFVFLMSRPTINLIKGVCWWNSFVHESIIFALTSLFLTLIFMFIGAVVASSNLKPKKEIKKTKFSKDFNQSLQNVSLFVFYFSMLFFMYLEFDKLMFMQGKAYEDLFVEYEVSAPYIIYVISTFYKHALCIFLSTKPTKNKAFIPLCLYLLSAVPSLLIGLRNPIMLNALFILSYYFIRDAVGDKEKWIGPMEKTALILLSPLVLILMGSYNYIRADQSVNMNTFEILVDFLFKQGVSFEVLMMGYMAIPKLPIRPIRNYTFGGFIDYVLYGTIGQLIFNTSALPSGNNVIQATVSNNFAHNMSYIAHPNYLEGHGWGTSYLLETYVDYGWLGVILFSLFLGYVLIKAIYWFQSNTFFSTIILLCLTDIFFTPRFKATGFLNFIIQMQFIVSVIICYFGAAIFTKKYELVHKEKRRYFYV